jgi:aquaporin Z
VASKLTAELLGTFWLVLGGCGSAVLAAAFPDVGIGLLGVSLAFGLTVVSGAYAFGPISGGAPVGFAGLAIGLGLTLIHLISIPVSNTSVNPARSTATAMFAGGWAVQQLWLFWLAPLVGAAIAGFLHKALLESPIPEPPVTGRATSGALAGEPVTAGSAKGSMHTTARHEPQGR